MAREQAGSTLRLMTAQMPVRVLKIEAEEFEEPVPSCDTLDEPTQRKFYVL